MEITELKTGQRVRVPSDKEGKNHYAYVTDIISVLYGEELVIIRIPALAVEKTVDPKLLIPMRTKPRSQKKK